MPDVASVLARRSGPSVGCDSLLSKWAAWPFLESEFRDETLSKIYSRGIKWTAV